MATLSSVLACLVALLVIVFHRALLDDQQFAFQDAGHFYYPLLQRVQQEWDAGRWPLWAPEASAGTPLLGNPTAAVLYPGKLLFFLLPFAWAFRLYAIGHVALAYLNMALLLQGWGRSRSAVLLGALAYAFGVPVLSQTSNVIFLVGAAWAPLGFLAADRWAREGQRWALPGLALVLALQVLGGDPEAAYLTVIGASSYAFGIVIAQRPGAAGRRLRRIGVGLLVSVVVLLGLSWWLTRVIHGAWSPDLESAPGWKPPSSWVTISVWGAIAALLVWRARTGRESAALVVRVGGLVGTAALGLALSGAQLLPVLEYTGMSFRAAETGGYHDAFAYSAHPLQLLDALWPNVFGTLEAGYRSWLNALPPKPNSRFWMPSIYLGGLSLVLASAGFSLRRGPPYRVWMSWVALITLLGALGYHAGPLLWARCVPGATTVLGPIEPPFSWQVRTDGYLRDGDGSVYWFLASAFPGFRSFRYPPKLFVYTSLAVATLAAAGWDRLASGCSRRANRVALGLLILSAVGLAATFLAATPLRAWFENLAATLRTSDEPLDVPRAIRDVRLALTHGMAVLTISCVMMRYAARRPGLSGALAVVVTACDLALANAGHVVTVPQAVFEGTPRALDVIAEAERNAPSPGPFRVQRVGRWWPTAWTGAGAPRDFETIARWERMTLRPNYQLPLGVESTFYLDTIEPLDYGMFFLPWSLSPDQDAIRQHGLRPDQKVWYYPRRGFDLWNTRYFIVPARMEWDGPARGYASFIPNSTFLYPPLGAFEGPEGDERRTRWGATEDFRVLRNENAFPRAWVVHRARFVPPVRGLGTAERARTMQELLYQEDEFWRLAGATVRDPRTLAWVETDRPEELERFLSRAEPSPDETVTITHNGPQRVEMTAVLNSPGLVVVADLFYPGWRLTVDGRPAEVLRTNRAMRGVALTAGTHRLVFRYEPLSFRLGALLSLAGFAAWLALAVWASRSPVARYSVEAQP